MSLRRTKSAIISLADSYLFNTSLAYIIRHDLYTEFSHLAKIKKICLILVTRPTLSWADGQGGWGYGVKGCREQGKRGWGMGEKVVGSRRERGQGMGEEGAGII